MKRFIAGLLACLLLVMCGCASNVAPTESQQSSGAVQGEPTESTSIDISSGPAFEFTRTEFVKTFKDGFNNLPDGFDAPNAFENEPSVTESLGCNVYTFEVDTCTEFVVYAHPETDKVIRAMIRSLSGQMEEKNATTFGTYAAFLTGFFASSDEIDEMDEALAIADTPYTQNTINFFHGRNAEFSYTITDGLLWVRISPVEQVSQNEDAHAPSGTTNDIPTGHTPTTAEDNNALNSAIRYLNVSAFSHDGLVDQLEYEGFSHDSAAFAADNCGADWNQQALQSAKSYLRSSAFSYTGLISQLEYVKFTTDQATYAADNCGADWYEQAAKKAKSYLHFGSWSREKLIGQLEYSGFTHEQAVYGAEQNGY